MTHQRNIPNALTAFVRASLALVVFAACAAAQVNVGISGGFAGGLAKEGVAGFAESAFKPSDAFGASLNYRFHNGFFVGLRAEQFRMGLKENSDALGHLKVQPALLVIGYQGKPARGRGVAGHVELGGGIGQTRFEKGPAITDLERLFPGARIVVRTRSAPVVEMGGGVDYFVSRHVSFTSDFRVLLSNVDTEWSAVGYRTVRIPQINKFFASNGQVLGGIRFWLW